jgi:Carboxypeptidase regulatory-like domain
MLIALAAVPDCGAATASVSGLVRNSAGTPQIGAEVQLLRPDLTLVATVYTDAAGRFKFSALFPGHYSVKALDTSYLPSMRENVKVRTATVVNLTLNTLYEVMQWLPSQPRTVNSQKDDWAWTLRSAENRPLLRWLEDGPLVVVTDGPGTSPRLKARLMATGQAGTFGESGQRFSASVEDTPSGSKELLARVDFAPDTDAGMESMLGFRQDLGFAGSVQSVAAISIHPEVSGPDGGGTNEASVSAWESMHLGDEFDIDAGATQVMGRLNSRSPSTVVAALPNASVTWHGGNSSVGYRMASLIPTAIEGDGERAQRWMPAMSVRNGELVLERGMHNEMGWSRTTDTSGMSVVVYSDNIQNPVIEARGNAFVGGGQGLFDRTGNMMRIAGPGFSTQGVVASVEHRLPRGNQVRLSYANGSALVMPGSQQAVVISRAVNSAHPRRAEAYSISLSGTLEGTGTKWRASYRWQPEDTLTVIAPYSLDAVAPYLNLRIRQTLRTSRDGSSGIEALLDVQNLLAQGYFPYLMKDGSVLVFAQQQRGIRGGLAFTF